MIESRLALEALREAGLRNPNFIGRVFFGVPSHRPVPTAAARDIIATAEAERELTAEGEFTPLIRPRNGQARADSPD